MSTTSTSQGRSHGANSAEEPTVAADRGTIALRLHDVDQLFDTLDPSPFREKDLDPKAEEFIVESAHELCSGHPRELVLLIDPPAASLAPPVIADAQRAVSDAIHTHFARRAELIGRGLRRLLRRGLISLVIGMSFLMLLFTAVQVLGLAESEGPVATPVRESLMIFGWVSLWRPMEIFLFDWWPIAGERRLHNRLSRVNVRVVLESKA